MPVRAELIDEAVDDLVRCAGTGRLPLFLNKLIRLEEVGKDAGLLLGGGLAGWRRIVVGDRNWRIPFTTSPEETVATVWVIGDRDDAECYEEAQLRLRDLGNGQSEAASLAASMFQLGQRQKPTRKTKRHRR